MVKANQVDQSNSHLSPCLVAAQDHNKIILTCFNPSITSSKIPSKTANRYRPPVFHWIRRRIQLNTMPILSLWWKTLGRRLLISRRQIWGPLFLNSRLLTIFSSSTTLLSGMPWLPLLAKSGRASCLPRYRSLFLQPLPNRNGIIRASLQRWVSQ